MRPGGRFFLVAHNTGSAAVRVEAELGRARGVQLVGTGTRRVAPGQVQAIELEHTIGTEPGGALAARSEDAPRREWWGRRDWRVREISLPVHLRIREERFTCGSPTLFFPPGVREQRLRLWNDAESVRPFVVPALPGLQIFTQGARAEGKVLSLPPGASVEFTFHADRLPAEPVREGDWLVEEGREGVAVIRYPAPRRESGADAVIAIDFGTRNTSVRVRWRRTLLPGKPAGTVDAVGDRENSPRFPTQMVLHREEKTFRWGSDAALYVAQRRLTADEVAVDNLKTYLREGHDRFTDQRPEWTNQELLRRYMERLLHQLDRYFRTIDPSRPLVREGLNLQYVLSRPVLDANEGDTEGRAYEQALIGALEACGVQPEAIRLVQEPVAATIGIARRREEELLALPPEAAVAVVDSGGGTTHIALARVRVTAGRLGLSISGSYALRLEPENPAVEALAAFQRFGFEDRREVGGNVLDTMLAFLLGTDPSRILESEGKPIPENLWRPAGQTGPPVGTPQALARGLEIMQLSRQMKERFARASTQYLNRAPGEPREKDEVLPFPNRTDLQGIYLVHDLYDRHVLAPILRPVVEELTGRIARAQQVEGGIRLSEVRRVFYVGGTNIDPFVRLHFGRPFLGATAGQDPDAQSDARIRERLHAVVDGAVWFDEQLFSLSPVRLTLRFTGRDEVVVEEGSALLPVTAASPRFFSCMLNPGEDLDAALLSSGGGLPEPVLVARAVYRNETEAPEDTTLAVRVSREQGCRAEVIAGGRQSEQWRFVLA